MTEGGLAETLGAKLSGMATSKRIPGFVQRVRQTYEAAGLNRHEVARELGAAYSTLMNWEKGTSVPDTIRVVALAKLGGVRVGWLLEGEGPMFVGQKVDAQDDEVYPSLAEFLAELPNLKERITDDERVWLLSQRFHDQMGDAGNMLWWNGQLNSYRALRRGLEPEPPNPMLPSPKRRGVPMKLLPRNTRRS